VSDIKRYRIGTSSTGGSRDSGYVSAADFGAVANTGTDQTAAIQAAIDYAEANQNRSVFIPAGTYLVDGTLTIAAELTLFGVYAPTTSTATKFTSVGGTVLVAGTGTAGAAVVSFERVGGDNSNGLRLADLHILGSNHWNTASGAVNRVGVAATEVYTEVSIERVMITGFLRQGLRLTGVYDGHIIGCRIMWCGTAGTYPAIDMLGENITGGYSNTNAVHCFGLHVENCPFMLRIDWDSRHNQFVACKFEMNGATGTSSPIQMKDSYETVFSGCQFVARNADDTAYFATVTDQPALILISATGGRARVKLAECMFTTAPYSGGSATVQGSRWLFCEDGQVDVGDCDFNAAWAGTGNKALRLGDNAIFLGSRVVTRAKSGVRNLIEVGSNCVLDVNQIGALDPAATVTAGALFTATGSGNIFGGSNKISGSYFTILSGPATQTVQEVSRVATILPDADTTPDVGWNGAGPSASKLFKVSNTGATSVTTLDGAQNGDEVALLFTNGNTTLVHSAGFRLKGATNVTPGFANVIRMYFDSTTWFETSRNF
jgi:hypothetical protein